MCNHWIRIRKKSLLTLIPLKTSSSVLILESCSLLFSLFRFLLLFVMKEFNGTKKHIAKTLKKAADAFNFTYKIRVLTQMVNIHDQIEFK